MPQDSIDSAWTLLLAARDCRARDRTESRPFGMRLASDDRIERTPVDDDGACLVWRDGGVQAGPGLTAGARDLVDLYLPVLGASASRPVIVGHLGQSIDAQIATRSGDSCYVTGPENLTHMHRMRALCDAVMVGAGTVATDNPRLTTRLVAGPNPVRVVIDPDRRLAGTERLFNDGEATTLLMCGIDRCEGAGPHEEIVPVPRNGSGLELTAVVSALGRRGLHAIFIEGGGVTVSRWMTAGLLDRLQIATAPVMIGSGRPGLSLPPAPTMRACRRPAYRLYKMGDDILWDFDLRCEGPADDGQRSHRETPVRLR